MSSAPSPTPHPEPPTAPSARRRTVTSDGHRLAVVEVGSSNAPAWVLAHGAGSSARFLLAAVAGPVLAAGGRLVTYDLRGHGASSPAREVTEHHLDAHAADLAAVVATPDGAIAVVGGVSLGAHAAARVAASWPPGSEPAAVLACLPAWTGTPVRGTGPHAAIAAELQRVGVAGLLTAIAADRDLAPWLRETLLTDYARHDPDSLAAVLRSLDGGAAPGPGELARLTRPLAILGWPDDPGHPLDVAREWARLAPVTALVTLAIGDLDRDLELLGSRAVDAVRLTLGQVPHPVPRSGPAG